MPSALDEGLQDLGHPFLLPRRWWGVSVGLIVPVGVQVVEHALLERESKWQTELLVQLPQGAQRVSLEVLQADLGEVACRDKRARPRILLLGGNILSIDVFLQLLL